MVKPGFPFVIVENTASKRKTPTAIGFTSEQRAYGLDASIQSSSNPINTFSFIRDLLGMEYNEENLETLRNNFYHNQFIEDERGYIGFKVDLEEHGELKSYIFTVEEILSMILAHAKELAEIQSKGAVKNIYLTVPSHFTMNQRRMLNDACEMAGLESLGMIEENVAASVAFGVDRKDENSTYTVLMLNLGSSDFEATVVDYFARAENVTDKWGKTKLGEVVENIEIKSSAHTEAISGRAFDIELLKILAEHFNSMKSREGKEDILTKPRIVKRLFKEIPKIKDTLSANKEKMVNIPEVADYENLKMTITRAEFEKRIEKYLDVLKSTISQAIEKANITLDNISAVEIIGGALRVPRVKEVLQESIGDLRLGSHLNGDEAMSFGAAFIGANSSSSFQARKIFLHPLIEEPIYLNISSIDCDPENEDTCVHKRYLFYNGTGRNKKKFAIPTLHDLEGEFYTESLGVIHKFNLTGIPEILESEEYLNNGTTPKVYLEARFSLNGYVTLDKTYAKLQQKYMKEVKRKVLIEKNTTDTESISDGESPTETEDAPEVEAPPQTEEESSTEDSSTADSETESAEGSSEEAEEVEEPVEKPQYETIIEHVEKNRTFTKNMKFDEEYVGHQPLSKDMKINAIAHITDFEKRDKLILDTMAAKNKYEALLYSSRDWISEEENHKYTTPEVIEEFLKNITEGEDWLYEDGYDETLEVYQAKINEVNSTVSQIRYRKDEHLLREDILETTKTVVKNFTNQINEFVTFFPWIEEYKIDRLRELAHNSTEWFEEALEKQEQLALNEDPVLTTTDIRNKVVYVGYAMEQLSKTKKPKDWGKKEETPNNSTETEDILINKTSVETPEEEAQNEQDNSNEGASSEGESENNNEGETENEDIKEDL